MSTRQGVAIIAVVAALTLAGVAYAISANPNPPSQADSGYTVLSAPASLLSPTTSPPAGAHAAAVPPVAPAGSPANRPAQAAPVAPSATAAPAAPVAAPRPPVATAPPEPPPTAPPAPPTTAGPAECSLTIPATESGGTTVSATLSTNRPNEPFRLYIHQSAIGGTVVPGRTNGSGGWSGNYTVPSGSGSWQVMVQDEGPNPNGFGCEAAFTEPA